MNVRGSAASVASHSSSDNFDNITKPFDTADVAFVIDRSRLYFVRSIVASQSPVFHTLLYTNYSEGVDNSSPTTLTLAPYAKPADDRYSCKGEPEGINAHTWDNCADYYFLCQSGKAYQIDCPLGFFFSRFEKKCMNSSLDVECRHDHHIDLPSGSRVTTELNCSHHEDNVIASPEYLCADRYIICKLAKAYLVICKNGTVFDEESTKTCVDRKLVGCHETGSIESKEFKLPHTAKLVADNEDCKEQKDAVILHLKEKCQDHYMTCKASKTYRVDCEKVTIKEDGSAVQEVHLFDVDFHSFHSFLLVLVPAPLRQNIITEANVEKLLDIALKYETYAVIERCACFIQLHWKDKPMKHLRAVELAAKFRMPEVARVFLPLASCRPLSEIDAISSNLAPHFYAALLHGRLSNTIQQKLQNIQQDPVPYDNYEFECEPKSDAVMERAVKLLTEKPTTN